MDSETMANMIGLSGPWDSWSFGGDPDRLAELVRSGKKGATSSAYALYEIENEPLPAAGSQSVILDSSGNAVCVIRTTRVYVTPFKDVSREHAVLEGEGDLSLEYWRQAHTEFFSEELKNAGLVFDTDTPIVCEEFELVYPGPEKEDNCNGRA